MNHLSFLVVLAMYLFISKTKAAIESDPVCSGIQVADNLSWMCNISNVYPKLLCRFEYKKDNGSYQHISSEFTMTYNQTWGGDPFTYNMSCAMDIPVSSLQPGTYTFKVIVYSNVTGTLQKEDIQTMESTVELDLPEASIKNCPSGSGVKGDFIKEETTATCLCHLTNAGNPPGTPFWSNSKGEQVGQDISNGAMSLSLRFNKSDPNPSYWCSGSSPLGNGTGVSYSPQFAYGPVEVKIDPRSDFAMCEPNATFKASCDFLVHGVNPTASVKLEGMHAIINLIQTRLFGLVPAIYRRHTFTVNPTTGGILTMKCVAFNVIVPEITAKQERKISIYEPPSSDPVIIVDNGQSIPDGGVHTVTSGQIILVTCFVEGGYPAVSRVSITCADLEKVSSGNESSLTLDVHKGLDQKTCLCTAVHLSGCYNKTKEIILNVQYRPVVTKCSANSLTKSKELKDGDSLMFFGEAEGNPKPTISIQNRRSNENLNVTNFDSREYTAGFNMTRVMRCKDSDIYTCNAVNSVGRDAGKSISVFVKCPLEFNVNNQTNKEYTASIATNLKIHATIFGYPAPTNYSLVQVGHEETRFHRDVTVLGVNQSKYHVAYIPAEPPEGTVILWMFDLVYEDSGQYVLTISNGIGDGLDFNFNVFMTPGHEETRFHRDVTVLGVNQSKYHVAYIPAEPPEGTVILWMFDLVYEDSGQYVLTISNGIGDGLDFNFNVFMTPEVARNDQDMGLIVGVAVACGLVLAVVAFLLGTQVKRIHRSCQRLIPKEVIRPRPSLYYSEAYPDIQIQRQHPQQSGDLDTQVAPSRPNSDFGDVYVNVLKPCPEDSASHYTNFAALNSRSSDDVNVPPLQGEYANLESISIHLQEARHHQYPQQFQNKRTLERSVGESEFPDYIEFDGSSIEQSNIVPNNSNSSIYVNSRSLT